MRKILITGGTGFLGKRLAQAIDWAEDIVLADIVEATDLPAGTRSMTVDVSKPEDIYNVLTPDITDVFHFGAVVSSGAEADFDLGMRVNLDGTRNLLEACRALPHTVNFTFASSCAIFGSRGGALPSDAAARPESSYGVQKACGELLVNDYARKGFINGVSCRLPTVVVRPGKPNLAASSFASSIIREPIHGRRANCPVGRDTRMWLGSVKSVINNFLKAHQMAEENKLPTYRAINSPGIVLSVQEMLNALERAGGDTSLVDFDIDPKIEAIVSTWPSELDVSPELEMGFAQDEDFKDVIDDYIAWYA
jgi:nucleoside-diphosphate-sugar epimerase